jgi:hypothetical protein
MVESKQVLNKGINKDTKAMDEDPELQAEKMMI